MNRRLIALLITLLLTITSITVMSGQTKIKNITSPLNKEMIYVNGDNKEGPWFGTQEYPYQHINDGVLDATDWGAIYVFSGVYNETLTINKPISLQGENKNNTIIDGMYEECIVNIIHDYVSINNFTIRNSGGYRGNAGIEISSDNISISDCIIYRTKTGIYAGDVSNCEINNCTFYTNVRRVV